MLYEIHLPKVLALSEEGNHGVYAIEPLYPGFGLTLGNSLRRVILSSLPGAAVTAVKINGVSHEFGPIDGVKEDVIELILNLKQLRLRLHGDGPETVTLQASGVGKATAKDIKLNSNVEIVNSDHHIAELSGDKSKLNIEIRIEKGRGYVPVEQREEDRMEVGMIAIDAIYTPIRKVRYNVENTRVGKMTDLDKVIIEIETDGTMEPRTALETAANILVDHFALIGGKASGDDEAGSAPLGVADDKAAKILIEEISLSPRTTNALLNNELKTIADVLTLSDNELKTLKGFGTKAYEEVKDKLVELGFAKPAKDGEKEA